MRQAILYIKSEDGKIKSARRRYTDNGAWLWQNSRTMANYADYVLLMLDATNFKFLKNRSGCGLHLPPHERAGGDNYRFLDADDFKELISLMLMIEDIS